MNQQAQIKQAAATYQDFLDAPGNMVAQLIYGVLDLQPRPTPKHSLALSQLGSKMSRYYYDDDGDGPGGWWILDEPEVHLGGDILVPDIAGWRKETMPDFPQGAFIDIAPDWVCEVLSPATRKIDLTSKRDIYAREGVSHLWFVDPDAQTLEAFELIDGRWTLIAALEGEADVSVPPFDAVSFSLGALWP